ncbi:MAG: hypothetical protein JWO82_4369, partial [Akkermansiaceae bacterium]|nr:hypothetical protein [Akkermansiaceae bacterium]
MTPRFLCLPAQAVGWLSALVAGLAAAAEGDPGTPSPGRVQDRVSDRMVVPAAPKIDPQTGKVPTAKLTADVEVGVLHDDNIFLSAKDPKSDTVIRVSPSISYAKGDPSKDSTEGAYVRVGYKPSAIFYMKNSGDDRVDHQAGIDAGWHGQSAAIDYSGGLQRLSDATA